MDLVPQRNSLLSATTSVLRDAILSGEWVKELPGERKLCERMQVGRDTLRLALKQIEREGLIGKSALGCRRPIHWRAKGGGRKPLTDTRVIVYLTPHRLEKLAATALAEVDVLRGQLAESGFRLDIVNSPAFEMNRPGKSLEKLIAERKASAWILHQSTEPMQRWFFDHSLPCLLHGLPQEGIDLPFVDLDYYAIGRHAGGFLTGRGHHRVTMIRPGKGLRGLDLAEEGLREALASTPLVIHDGGTLVGLRRQIEILLGTKEPPTALVVTRSSQVLTVLTCLAQHGKRVPYDLSLVSLDYSPFHDHLVPQVACYRIDINHSARLLVKKVLELASSGSTTRSAQAMMPDFIPGESVAKRSK